MRQISLFQIFDIQGQCVAGPIMTAHHEGAAIRNFTDLLKNKETVLGAHPQDFELRFLGYQDEDTGILDGVELPHSVITGQQWQAMEAAKLSAPAGERPLTTADKQPSAAANGRYPDMQETLIRGR